MGSNAQEYGPVYLDHMATSPPDPEVVEAMLPYLGEHFGNPSSITHPQGRRALDAVEAARAEVAALIGADPSEIVFTSCATEANNLAIKGSAWAHEGASRRIVTSAVEHKSVLESCRWLEGSGFEAVTVPVDGDGRVDPGSVESAIANGAALVSVMHANSEVGTIMPVAAIGEECRRRSVRFHVDATQSAGKVPVDVERIGCDLLSLSAHKIYGPKGAGALYVRRRRRLAPLLSGGGQERGLRSGTHNVAAIVGFGTACRLARQRMNENTERIAPLRERLRCGLLARVPRIEVNGPLEERVPGNLNVSFEDLDGQALIESLRGISVSSGSACAAGSTEPSYVLLAMGLGPERALGSVRFGVGRGNTETQIDHAIAEFERAAGVMRTLSTRP
jgi:cysteine desulfurase